MKMQWTRPFLILILHPVHPTSASTSNSTSLSASFPSLRHGVAQALCIGASGICDKSEFPDVVLQEAYSLDCIADG